MLIDLAAEPHPRLERFLSDAHACGAITPDFNAHGSRAQFERGTAASKPILVAAGFVVLRFTAPQLRCEPLLVLATLTRALFARS